MSSSVQDKSKNRATTITQFKDHANRNLSQKEKKRDLEEFKARIKGMSTEEQEAERKKRRAELMEAVKAQKKRARTQQQ